MCVLEIAFVLVILLILLRGIFYSYLIMKENDDFTTEVNYSVLDKDFDEVAWEPEVIDDSDEEAAEEYGY